MTQLMQEAAVEQLADEVYAYIQPDGGWCVNNAGILLGRNGTVLVDTAGTEQRALRLRRTVSELSRRRVTAVINTHSHGDHTFGNHLFEQTAVTVAHEEAAKEMALHGLALTGLWPQVAWGHVEPGRPTLTFRDRMTINLSGVSDLEVQVIHLGPGHTAGDAVVWLPGPRVLFAGDLVFSGVTPFVLMGSVDGSLTVLDRLRALEPVSVVPGHGPVGGPELLDTNADYLRWVRGLARCALAEHLSPLELAEKTDLGPYGRLLDNERLVGNLVRAYAEAQGAEPGTPVDVLQAMLDMAEFHGGPLHCAA
jgi:cyclase